jgi:hypothetical protein
MNKKQKMEKYHKWYINTYKEDIHFSEFQERIKEYNWLKDSLNLFYVQDDNIISPIYFSSIWRHEVLNNLKIYITPKKTEHITTVFKMDRTQTMGHDRSVEFHTTFAFLYSTEEGHEYICLGPTYQSADGEYRERFITFKQFQDVMNHFEKLVEPVRDQIVKWIGKKSMGIQMESFFPNYMKKNKSFDKTQKAFMEKLDNDRIVINIYTAVWLLEYKRFDDNTLPNHLVPGYKETMFAPQDEKFYHDKIKPLDKSDNESFNARMESVIPYSGKAFNPARCGQKFIPLRVKDVEDCENIKHAPWREMYVSSLVGDMVINGICPGFPIFVDWFFIQTNSPDIWDNKVSHLKLDHSMVASDIVRKLEDARKGTYAYGDKGDTVYATYQMEGMSEAIEVPMNYAEKEIILAPVTLCSLVEHVGRTFADLPKMIEQDFYRKETGDLFGDPKLFSKYLFEYIYAIYCMNTKFQIIHTDLHLNNISMNNLRHFYKDIFDKEETTPIIKNAHIIYDIGDDKTEAFVFPHYGRYATIIDFSRGIVGREQLMKDFPEHKVDQIISNQRKRLLRTVAREIPDFYKSHAEDFEALILQNFDLAFKMLTVLDTYKLTKGMLGLIAQNPKLRTNDAIVKLLENVQGLTLKTLTTDMQKAFRREIKEYEYPNLHILRECFLDFGLSKFDQKASRRDDPNSPISIIDVFQARNPLTYNIRSYDSFPPNVKYDYIIEHNIDLDKSGLQKFHKHQKYLATNPEKRVAEFAEEMRESKEERRGTPPIPKKSSKPKKSAPPVDLLSSSPL